MVIQTARMTNCTMTNCDFTLYVKSCAIELITFLRYGTKFLRNEECSWFLISWFLVLFPFLASRSFLASQGLFLSEKCPNGYPNDNLSFQRLPNDDLSF